MKKTKNKEKITKKMSFAEIMEKFPEATEILLEKGMYCCGCCMAQTETLEQGAIAHELDADKLVDEINKRLFSKKDADKKFRD